MKKAWKGLLLVPVFLTVSCGGKTVFKGEPMVFPDFTVGVTKEKTVCSFSHRSTSLPSWSKRPVYLSMKEKMPFSSVLYALSKGGSRGNVIFEDGTDQKITFQRLPPLERAYKTDEKGIFSFMER